MFKILIYVFICLSLSACQSSSNYKSESNNLAKYQKILDKYQVLTYGKLTVSLEGERAQTFRLQGEGYFWSEKLKCFHVPLERIDSEQKVHIENKKKDLLEAGEPHLEFMNMCPQTTGPPKAELYLVFEMGTYVLQKGGVNWNHREDRDRNLVALSIKGKFRQTLLDKDTNQLRFSGKKSQISGYFVTRVSKDSKLHGKYKSYGWAK